LLASDRPPDYFAILTGGSEEHRTDVLTKIQNLSDDQRNGLPLNWRSLLG